MPIQIAQSCAPAGKDHWKWSVWLDGTGPELDGVDHVVYTLHPTFPEPVRRITERETAFRLHSGGWGEFNIHAAVHFRDGRVEKLDHWLVLGGMSRSGEEAVSREEAVRAPRIYLSYGLADALAANAIRASLNRAGVEVRTSDEVADALAGMPFEQVITQQLKSVSRAVFLVSEHSSPWLRREAEMAGRLGIPRAFITVGGGTPPADDDDPAAVSLHVQRMDPENADDAARTIAHWATNTETPAPVRVIFRGKSKD